MPYLIRSFAGFLVVLLIVACQQSPAEPEPGPLEGGWKSVEISGSGPDTSWTITSPQPSLYIFAKQHYGIMYATGSKPRALFNESAAQGGTDAEKVAAYDSFVANSGTYETTESTITTRPIVAKWPNFMTGEESVTFEYRTEGDSLWLTLQQASFLDEPPEVKTTTTLVRLE